MNTILVTDVNGFASNWWIILLRGVATILVGLFLIWVPALSLAGLVLVFGAFAFVDGILALVTAIGKRRQSNRWGAVVLEAAAGIGIGILTFLWPGVTLIALVYLIAAWAIITGAFELTAAVKLRKVIVGEWLLGLSGIASIVFGILIWLFPGAGAIVLTIWLGAYAIVFGVLLTILGLRLRSWVKREAPRVLRTAAQF